MAETVLIVEDDQDIVELLSLYLTGSGYDVVTAGNGEDALEQLRQHPADIALVDIMMPRMNGYDFIKALRGQHPRHHHLGSHAGRRQDRRA